MSAWRPRAVALGEHPLQLADPGALEERLRQPRSPAHLPARDQPDREAQAEQAEPGEQVLADLLAERVALGVAEALDRRQQMIRGGLEPDGDLAQPAELGLAQRRPGLGEQPGDGTTPGRELADAGDRRIRPATARAESSASGRAAPISSARTGRRSR